MKRLLMFCLLLCLALGAQSAQAAPFTFGAASFDDSLSLLENLETVAPGAFTPYELGNILSKTDTRYYNMIGVTDLGASGFLRFYTVKRGTMEDDYQWYSWDDLAANWPTSAISNSERTLDIACSHTTQYWDSSWYSETNGIWSWDPGTKLPTSFKLTDAYIADSDIVYQPAGAEVVTFAAGTVFFALDYDGMLAIITISESQPQLGANPVPVPAAVWLLGSGLAGLGALRRKMA